MSWFRYSLAVGMPLVLVIVLAGEGFAQRSVRVQGPQAQGTEQRVALVIGNSAYTRISKLRNPVNDARAMSKVLRASGFQVTILVDADRGGMLRAIEEFGLNLRNGGVGLFYFAGHGVQAQGRNYLVPLGARVQGEADLEYEALDAGRVLAKMENAQNRLNIIILDACRNNPYRGAFRSARNGLAQVGAPSGSLVAYATGPGKVAADGDGQNGLYTEQLVRHMRTPGLKLEEVFKQVRIDVQRLSGGKQVPWENTSLTGEFFFIAAKPANQLGVGVRPKIRFGVEEEFWAEVRASKDTNDLIAFLKQFPTGRFSEIARIKLKNLSKRENPSQAVIIRKGNRPNIWRDPVIGMEFRKISGGFFQMGCHSFAGDCGENEKPVRTVRVDGFWMG